MFPLGFSPAGGKLVTGTSAFDPKAWLMVRDFVNESLAHDPIHSYIPIISRSGLPAGETAEQELIDHP